MKFDAYCKFPTGYTPSVSDTFLKLNDVKVRCDEMTDCTMFYKYNDGENKFSICPSGSVVETSHQGSQIYIKGIQFTYV